MRKVVSRAYRPLAAVARSHHGGRLVVATAAALIVAQLCFRAWALYPSWFFADDYVLLRDALEHDRPGLGYLFTAFNIHFMPVGRGLAWVVAHSGTASWGVAASLTLVLQLLASVAFLHMLTVLFGNRWANVPLLALYLTSSMSVPSLMWWAATLNQLPLQIAYFVAISTWVRYLRGEGHRYLAVAASAVVLGLLSDVRGMLVIPLLGLLLVAYWSEGRLVERVRRASVRYWPGVVTMIGLAAAYVVYYVLAVPPPFEDGEGGPLSKAGEIADAMLGTALPVGAWGGPWQWMPTGTPLLLSGPPPWTVHLSWVLSAAVMAYALLRRTRAGRSFVLLAAHAGALFVLLAASRGQIYGLFAGLEYRYLSEMAYVVPLCLGLAFMSLPGAVESSTPRHAPLLALRVRPRYAASIVAAVAIGSVWSTTTYVHAWHQDNANRDFSTTARSELSSAEGTPHLARQTLPDQVMPGYTTPLDQTTEYLPLIASNFTFPEASDRLQVLDAEGRLRPALLDQVSTAVPGRVPDCGLRLTSRTAVVPLRTPTGPGTWWVRLGYLANRASPVEVGGAGEPVRTRLRPGLHSLFVELEGSFSSIRISGLEVGAVACLDTVEVGTPVAVGGVDD